MVTSNQERIKQIKRLCTDNFGKIQDNILLSTGTILTSFPAWIILIFIFFIPKPVIGQDSAEVRHDRFSYGLTAIQADAVTLLYIGGIGLYSDFDIFRLPTSLSSETLIGLRSGVEHIYKTSPGGPPLGWPVLDANLLLRHTLVYGNRFRFDFFIGYTYRWCLAEFIYSDENNGGAPKAGFEIAYMILPQYIGLKLKWDSLVGGNTRMDKSGYGGLGVVIGWQRLLER